MDFSLEHQDSASSARAGRISTDHGEIRTPVFMPVGTVGSVRAVWPSQLKDPIGAQIILGNTYHLFLRPGTEIIAQAGGLHSFMNWDRPILTDSGGYQVFSLASRRTLSEDGVEFQSHIDGSYRQFTPESIVDIQRAIGADIMMVLDECPAGDVSEAYAASSNEMTIRWAKRCKERAEDTDAHYGHQQSLFGIVQGVVYPDIRR
ncbi:MAG: tRNA-guanine transglycosylase, partial [Rhodothermales bacterium]|nr:tRNA-guanine transglycosylase [Rhodothermales bacterium]